MVKRLSTDENEDNDSYDEEFRSDVSEYWSPSSAHGSGRRLSLERRKSFERLIEAKQRNNMKREIINTPTLPSESFNLVGSGASILDKLSQKTRRDVVRQYQKQNSLDGSSTPKSPTQSWKRC